MPDDQVENRKQDQGGSEQTYQEVPSFNALFPIVPG